jgi:DNA-binding IclR family transcriptional regulator
MSMGLTVAMKHGLAAILALIARHGVAPTREALASELEFNKSSAQSLIDELHLRGAITRSKRGAIALGSGGVSVVVPADVAAKLAAFCAAHDESVSAVVADAITPHLDQLASDPSAVESGSRG